MEGVYANDPVVGEMAISQQLTKQHRQQGIYIE
jgi:hypothetical protein